MAVAASAGKRTMRSTTLSFLIGLASATALMAQHGRYLNESKNPTISDPKAVEAGAQTVERQLRSLPWSGWNRRARAESGDATGSGTLERPGDSRHHSSWGAWYGHASHELFGCTSVEPGGFYQGANWARGGK